jgi:hypothetical protein
MLAAVRHAPDKQKDRLERFVVSARDIAGGGAGRAAGRGTATARCLPTAGPAAAHAAAAARTTEGTVTARRGAATIEGACRWN